MDRILTLVLSLLKARVLSLDQILDWDDSVSTVYLFRSHILACRRLLCRPHTGRS